MNVSSQPIILPTTHRRRFLTTTRTPTFIDPSPIAVSNKIKAIQARKTRLNSVINTTGHTDIRPLNFGQSSSLGHSKSNVTIWTAERLVNRSKDLRLDRFSTRRFGLTTTTTAGLWPNCPPSAGGNKQIQTNSNSTTITPPAISSIKNKSAGGKMPELPRRQLRPPLTDQHNSAVFIDIPSPIRTINHIHIRKDLVEEELEELVIDKEFEEYLERAIIKCADWLLKYVFIEKNN